jgi:hypothetical protein
MLTKPPEQNSYEFRAPVVTVFERNQRATVAFSSSYVFTEKWETHEKRNHVYEQRSTNLYEYSPLRKSEPCHPDTNASRSPSYNRQPSGGEPTWAPTASKNPPSEPLAWGKDGHVKVKRLTIEEKLRRSEWGAKLLEETPVKDRQHSQFNASANASASKPQSSPKK